MWKGTTARMKLLVALLGTLALSVGTAQAIPGPDPADEHPSFNLEINAEHFLPKDITTFEESEGWDFGDRAGYRCAWVEFFQAGTELFEVSYHAVSDYPGEHLEISDKYGDEAPDATISDECWSPIPIPEGRLSPDLLHDGSDHFPHGTSLVFNDIATGAEIARIDYPNQCANLYWTPGDEAAEAWLWWDEDGPADKFEHGDGLCGGGPEEPVAIVQARVRNLAPGIQACVTDAMDGDMCFPAETTAVGSVSGTLDDGRPFTTDVSVFGLPDASQSCGTGTITLADGRQVETTVCA